MSSDTTDEQWRTAPPSTVVDPDGENREASTAARTAGISRRDVLRTAAGFALAGGLAASAAPDVLEGAAAQSLDDATVVDGNARFQVLTSTLVRLEYAPDGDFQDRPTFFAIDRDFETPAYRTSVENGQRVVETDDLTLRYERGSGPFSTDNVTVELDVAGESVTAAPEWDQHVCTFGSVCQAEGGDLRNVGTASGHTGYTGSGYVAGFVDEGTAASYTVEGVPADGTYTLHMRYANDRQNAAIPADADRTLSVSVDGEDRTQATFPDTGTWDDWGVQTVDLDLSAGRNTISLSHDAEDVGNLNLDFVALTEQGADTPEPQPAGTDANLGGWYRALDGVDGAIDRHDGLLSRDGWYLLDDSATALLTDDWAEPRPERDGVYRDGYLFGYGHDYERGLSELADLTGHPPLLPRWAFGNWFSRYYAYTTRDYEEDLLPTFRDERVPLDVLVIDTDWKSPFAWNGWNWDADLFPNPEQFLEWTAEEGLHVTLNVHPSIDESDPRFDEAVSRAGGSLSTGGGFSPNSHVWDWSDPEDAASYFWLHRLFDQQGVDFWWLDWCCDGSYVSMDGLTGDSWINGLYADHLERRGRRGFAFSRIGSSLQRYGSAEPGPWAAGRYSAHFTGDTISTWDTLDFETMFTHEEGNVGVPYVTHDIGGFNGDPSPELYGRWIQLGAFQPILRVHSNHGRRVPWKFPQPAHDVAAEFMRLRESLVPYLYSTARTSHETGLPMARGMYLAYPEADAAYEYDHQYMLGDELLVAPVGQPGIEFKGTGTYQAEAGDLSGGATVATNHDGYEGSGFVAGYQNDGASTEWTIALREAGTYVLRIRYANNPDLSAIGPDVDRTLSVSVDGEDRTQVTFPSTGSWDAWGSVEVLVDLEAGENTIALTNDSDDTGNVNLDAITVGQTCTVDERCQAEDATLTDGTGIGSAGGRDSDGGYVEFNPNAYPDRGGDGDGYGAAITWTIYDVPSAGEYDVHVRYALDNDVNAVPADEPNTLSLYVDGSEAVEQIGFDDTGGWGQWAEFVATVSLDAGTNTVELRHDQDDTGGVNVDFLAVTQPGESIPPADETSTVPIEPAEKDVWFPEGEWVDFFTGEVHEGPASETLEVPFDRMPVFQPAGSIVPRQPYMDHVGKQAVDPLKLDVATGADGSFTLYEDAGTGLAYRDGQYATTAISYDDHVEQEPGYAQGGSVLTVEGARGTYPDQPAHRDYEVRFGATEKPSWVRIQGEPVSEVQAGTTGETDPDSAGEGWWYDAEAGRLTVYVEKAATDGNLTVSFGHD